MYIWSSSAKEAEEFSMALQTLFSFFSFICSAMLNLCRAYIVVGNTTRYIYTLCADVSAFNCLTTLTFSEMH